MRQGPEALRAEAVDFANALFELQEGVGENKRGDVLDLMKMEYNYVQFWSK